MATTNWFTPNTYDACFREPPETSGVYCIKEYDVINKTTKVVYVGSSGNLFCRYHGHPVLKKLRRERLNPFLVYAFYFKEIPYGYLDHEIRLIKRLRPRLNKQHNNGKI